MNKAVVKADLEAVKMVDLKAVKMVDLMVDMTVA